MQHSSMPEDSEQTYCLRHPDTESNLRCGRCGDLICPRCMVTSPVGARCPSCARIGRPAILDTSPTELSRAILFALVSAIIGALGLAIALRVLISLPFAITLVDLVVIAGGMAGIGFFVGEAVRYGSGKKLDRRLKYVAAGGVMAAWIASAIWLPLFNVSPQFMASLNGIIGLIVAFYVAASRVRL